MNIENKKIISFDLDMTLLDHKQGMRIPESALETIKHLRRQHKIVLATGRNMHLGNGEELLRLIRPEAIIHMNGARVEEKGKYLSSYPLPQKALHRLIYEAQSRGWCVGTYINDKYCCTNSKILRKREKALFGNCTRELGPFEWILEQKQLFAVNALEDTKVINEMQNVCPELCFMRYGTEYGCDIVKKGVSKAEGIKILLEKWGFTFENVIAIGDSSNDIELLKAAGIGIAMGNAEDEVKHIADYVTEAIGKSGVQKAFQHLGMI